MFPLSPDISIQVLYIQSISFSLPFIWNQSWAPMIGRDRKYMQNRKKNMQKYQLDLECSFLDFCRVDDIVKRKG